MTSFAGRWNSKQIRERLLQGTWADADPFGMVTIYPDTYAVYGTGSSYSVTHGTNQLSFTNATAVALFGCFESLCDNYVMYLSHTASTSQNIFFRFYQGTTEISTSTYSYQYVNANHTTLGAARTASTTGSYLAYNASSTQRNAVTTYFYGPYLSQPTTVYSKTGDSTLHHSVATMHATSAQYDGFYVAPDAGTMSGTVSLYGFKGN